MNPEEQAKFLLLELVDEIQEEINHALDYNLANQELTLENQRLQEQVRSLQRGRGESHGDPASYGG